jgi:hypothetical protein
MTLDFVLGFAGPFAKIVRISPQGLRGWFFFWMAKRHIAQDGYVFMFAFRLIGITIGVTVTIECHTSATPNPAESSQNIAGQSAPPSLPSQFSADQLAQIRAMVKTQQVGTGQSRARRNSNK